MEMLSKIRRLYLRDKLSLSEISRRTGLSRNTVKNWLKKPELYGFRSTSQFLEGITATPIMQP